MKKLFLIFALLWSALQLTAQTKDIYVTENMSSDQKSVISKAKRNITRADRLYQSAEKVYDQYKKLLESDKKGKRKKGEKKSVAGKQSLMQAATYYDKGFQSLFEVYYNRIDELTFQLPENKQKALEYRNLAEDAHNQGQRYLKGIKNYTEKELKKDVEFKSMLNKVKTGKNKEYEAIGYLVKAINLYNNEARQIKEMKDKDNNAWNRALQANTIEAYQDYLSMFPTGLHAQEAQKKIADLEEQIRQAEQQSQVQLVYRVQILAAKRPWKPEEIRQKIYSKYGQGNVPVFSLKMGPWYKYYIGEFSSYQDAKAFATKLRMKVKTKPFVVGFVDDQPVNILEALNVEQQSSGE